MHLGRRVIRSGQCSRDDDSTVPTLTLTRLPMLARLTAVVIALGTCQLAAAGMVTDRGRQGQLGRSAGNRLSASRSETPGCELAVRDGSRPGEVLAPPQDDLRSSPRCPSLPLPVFAPLLRPRDAGTLLVLSRSTPALPRFAPAIPGRGPPRG
jgi:hypothetical protein